MNSRRTMNKKTRNYGLLIASAFILGMVFPRAYSAADQTYQQLKVLVDVLELVRDNYVDEVDTQKLVYGAASGIVHELDDFSQFMDPDAHKKIKSDTEGEFGGLGIRIMPRDGYITIISPIPGTPAYKAGLLPGDKIIKIEDESTKGMNGDEALKRLRGQPGTKVKITIAREPEKKDADSGWTTLDFTLERAKIVPEVVQSKMLESNIGYIRLIDFSGHSVEDTAKALDELSKKGMEALVLDVRYNPGGLLTAAIDVCKFFVGGNKMLVYTKGRRPETYQEYKSGLKAPYDNLPMVVLVNGGSASGSEIVAGALQDHKRAVVIGSQTFGKGSVQSLIPLSDGSGLRLTVSKYYTPSGRTFHRNPKDGTGGITPDIEVKLSREAEIKIMEQFEQLYTPGKEPVSAVKKEEMVKDEPLSRAVEILKARKAFTSLTPS